MKWTYENRIMLLREMYIAKPYCHPFGSNERGEAWKTLANKPVTHHHFNLTQRSDRENIWSQGGMLGEGLKFWLSGRGNEHL